MATLKLTKTGRIMLRCNTSGTIVFANGMLAQEQIKRLPDYQFKNHMCRYYLQGDIFENMITAVILLALQCHYYLPLILLAIFLCLLFYLNVR